MNHANFLQQKVVSGARRTRMRAGLKHIGTIVAGGISGALAIAPAMAAEAAPVIDSGDTAWVLTASELVLMMTLPGLALFYGGLVERRVAVQVGGDRLRRRARRPHV